MTLDASGNLLVGLTGSNGDRFQVESQSTATNYRCATFRSVAAGTGFSKTSIQLIKGTSNSYGAEISGYLEQGIGAGLILSTVNDGSGVGASVERARIDSSGNLLVNTTTTLSGAKFAVNGPTYVNSTGTFTGALVVGTAAAGVPGEIRATNEITAYYSDRRLKENVQIIDNAVVKVLSLTGITYTPNALAESYGYDRTKKLAGLFADEVDAVLPEAVRPAPFDDDGTGGSKSGENYQTVQYEKLIPLLVEAIKEQQQQIFQLKKAINSLSSKE
jgi:hypothetical protein